ASLAPAVRGGAPPAPLAAPRETGARGESGHATTAEQSRKAPRAPVTGARAVSPRPECQADAVAFLVERDVIDQMANDEQPAPVFPLDVVGVRRIRQPAGIETVAVVDDVDPHH